MWIWAFPALDIVRVSTAYMDAGKPLHELFTELYRHYIIPAVTWAGR